MGKKKKLFSFTNDSFEEAVNTHLNKICHMTGFTQSRVIEYLLLTGLDGILEGNVSYSDEVITRMRATYGAIAKAFNLDE